MDHDITADPSATSIAPAGFITSPVRLTGRELTEVRRAFRVYMRGGPAAWDTYDRLLGEGLHPVTAAAWAVATARREVVA
jgi:hypothetical protein